MREQVYDQPGNSFYGTETRVTRQAGRLESILFFSLIEG